jgi:hypothetical protein
MIQSGDVSSEARIGQATTGSLTPANLAVLK